MPDGGPTATPSTHERHVAESLALIDRYRTLDVQRHELDNQIQALACWARASDAATRTRKRAAVSPSV